MGFLFGLILTLGVLFGVPLSPGCCFSVLFGCYFFEKFDKNEHLENVHPSRAPGPCCPKGFPRPCSLSVVICVFFDQKPSKTAPLCSAKPVLPNRFSPSALAVRSDLRVFCDFGYWKTCKSRRTASTDGGSLLGNTGLALQRGAHFQDVRVYQIFPTKKNTPKGY